MDWLQVLTIAASTIGAIWFIHRENVKMYQDFAKETKDFHGRLCTLEEKYFQILHRLWEKK